MPMNRLKAGLLAISIAASGAFFTAPDNVAMAAGTLRIGNVGEPASLDPHYVSGTWENRIVGDLFLGLTTEAGDGTIIPGAAESWTISEDGTIYTFTLRDHSWSDGVKVKASDFEFAMKRILKPETASSYASLLYTIKNGAEVNSGKLPADELAIKALDDKTLQIELVGPAPYFIAQLSHYTAYPLPEHKLKELGKEWAKDSRLVGNGAYTLKEWTPNAQIEIVKNPRFYDAENVSIDNVFFYPQEDRAAVLKRVRAGEIDVATDFASSDLKWLKKNMPEYIRIAPYLGVYYYPLNMSHEALKDIRVRQALAMTVDRETLTNKVLRTGEIPAYSMVPPGTGTYGEPSYVDWKDLPQAEKNKKAQELMTAAGYGKDNPLTVELSYNTSENHKKVAIAVSAMWKKNLGVKTTLSNSEVKVHYKNLDTKQFEIGRAGWIADYNDPQNFLYLLEDYNVKNYAGYDNDQYDALMKQASLEGDMEKRDALMHQAEALAMAEVPNIPIYYYVSKQLVNPRVKGWIDNPGDYHRARFLSVE